MGWRISLYRLTKKTADKWKDITREQYHTEEVWDKMYEELTSECIFYDTLTDILRRDREKQLHDDYFKNDVDDPNMAVITISKEQFLSIIMEVREKIIEWFDGRRIDAKGELGSCFKEKPLMGEPWNTQTAMEANQGEWNIKADRWKIRFKGNESDKEYHYPNIDLTDKWKVSGGWSYEYLIFDLIHIYKIFDWDNDVLLAIGV